MTQSLRQSTYKSMLWKIVDVGIGRVLQLVITIVLARLILPEQFGIIAMLGVFLGIATAFIDSGFVLALIRKQNRTQLDLSTVFYFNIVVAALMYAILYISAPLISKFFEVQELTNITRVVSIGLIIGSFGGVQNAIYTADLNFKIITRYRLISQIISGVVGVYLAYHDWQVWALVVQQLSATALNVIFLWIASKWRPSLCFSFKVLRDFFSFGSKLMFSWLLGTIYNNIYSLVIGKFFSASKLAFYNRAYGFMALASETPTTVLDSVTYPVLCKVQDDYVLMERIYRQMLRVSAFVVFPLCLGIGAVAYPLVNVLLGPIWSDAAPLLTILVFGGMWIPIQAINLSYLKVTGKTGLFLRIEVIKKIIGFAIIFMSVPFGLDAVCYGTILSALISICINTYYTGKFLNLSIFTQLRDIAPSFFLSITMFIIVKIVATMLGDDIVSLIVSICVGVVLYLGVAYLIKSKDLQNLISLINKR